MDDLEDFAVAMELISEIGVSWMKQTTTDGAYVEHQAKQPGTEGMGGDDSVECATDECEGDDIAGRPERVVSNDLETAVVDEFYGESEKRHGDWKCV